VGAQDLEKPEVAVVVRLLLLNQLCIVNSASTLRHRRRLQISWLRLLAA
jgi:hypothetical protein